MKMIKSIIFDGYRNLNFQLQDCEKINLISGNPTSGKTTLLKSILNIVNSQNNEKITITLQPDISLENIDILYIAGDDRTEKTYLVSLTTKDYYHNFKDLFKIYCKGNETTLPAYTSYGFLKILNIADKLESIKENSILLLDDLELYLHPLVIPPLITYLLEKSKEKNLQLFIVGYYEVLDAILDIQTPERKLPNYDDCKTKMPLLDDFVLFDLNRKKPRFYGELVYRCRYERGLPVLN